MFFFKAKILPKLSILFLLSLSILINCKAYQKSKISEQVNGAEGDFLRCKGDPQAFALIVTGWALNPVAHEFALRSMLYTAGLEERGYCVVTLFPRQNHPFADSRTGEIKEPSAEDAKFANVPKNKVQDWITEEKKRIELLHYRKDKEYFRSIGLDSPDRDATVENINRFFSSVSSLDLPPEKKKVFIALSAHGNPSYSEDEIPLSVYSDEFLNSMKDPNAVHDFCSDRRHTCVLAKCGQQDQFETKQLVPHLNNLSDKGFKTSLVMTSCHSGLARKLFTKTAGLCLFTSNIGASASHGCAETDSAANEDYTSTADSLMRILSKNSFAKFSSDKYFSGQSCFEKYSRINSVQGPSNFANLRQIYLGARRSDKTWDHAALNSFDEYEYFNRDQYSLGFRYRLTLDLASIDRGITQLINAYQGSEPKIRLHARKDQLLERARRYQSVAEKVIAMARKRLALYEANPNQSPGPDSKLLAINENVKQLEKNADIESAAFLEIERSLVNDLVAGLPQKEGDHCADPL